MKINTIADRYIIKEMIPPFLISLGFFTFLFMMTEILEITQIVVNYKTSMVSVFLILLYTIPYFHVYVVPMSVMMSVLVTFLRLSADNEIVALNAGGISLYRLVLPVLIFCLAGGLITMILTIYGLPWGKRSLKTLISEVAVSNVDVGLKERSFNDSFEGVMLYVSKIDLKSKTLMDIFIEDQRNKDTGSTVVVAPRGKLFSDPEEKIFQLRLFNGSINRVSLENRNADTITFDTYDIQLDLKDAISDHGNKRLDEKEMYFREIIEFLNNYQKRDKDYYEVLIEYHRKFSLPVTCLTLGILALPLGLQSKTARRSLGLVLGLIAFLIYYLLLSAGKSYSEAGIIPVYIGMWAPNAVMTGAGIFLLVRASRQHTFQWRFIPEILRRCLIRY